MSKPLILVGGGGHCKSVIDVAESAGYTILGIMDMPEMVGTIGDTTVPCHPLRCHQRFDRLRNMKFRLLYISFQAIQADAFFFPLKHSQIWQN